MLKFKSDLAKALRLTAGAVNSLLGKFQDDQWLQLTTTDVKADELILTALNKIEIDEKNYEVFILMLEKVDGTEGVLKKIKGK